MNQPEHEQLSQEDSQVEIMDLELPVEAEYRTSLVSPYRFLQWQHKLNRKNIRWFMSMALLLLVALVVLLSMQSGSSILPNLRTNLVSLFVNPPQSQAQQQTVGPAIRSSLIISPPEDGLACLMSASWSPDSRYIAFIGYQKGCWQDEASSGNGLVVIHDAVSGSVVDRIKPDTAIEADFHKQFPENHNRSMTFYDSVLWSPGGTRLAILFSIEAPPPLPTDVGPSYAGVFLLDAGSGQTWVFLQPKENNFSSVEWDLQLGQSIATPAISAQPPTFMGNFPVADSYAWGANGLLTPAWFPAAKSSNPVLIGNPIGNSSFTIWQSGIAFMNSPTPNNIVPNGPQVYLWATSFAAWSPDGRYLFSTLNLGARLTIPGEPAPSRQTLSTFHLGSLPTLPVRDAALHHLVQTLSMGSIYWLGWHPKGGILAQYDPATVDLDLFDCHTGYEIASLLLPTSAGYQSTSNSFSRILRWSPNGKRLLLFDQQVGNVGVWNIKV